MLDVRVLFQVCFFIMDVPSKTTAAAVIFFSTLVLNFICGYFRAKSRKYSFRWFLYIHLPVPLVVAARACSHLDYGYIPLFLLAAVVGQILGGRLEI